MDILHRAQDRWAERAGQYNGRKHNLDILPEMVPFIQEVNAVQWSVFFLVPTGRAQVRA
jgi:hypothetical protein